MDPLSNNLELTSGFSARVVQGFTVFNFNTDLTYGVYGGRVLASGVQGGETAAFAHLGTESDLVGRKDCNTAGGGQYFASLHVANGTVVAVDTCGSGNSCPQTFREVPGVEAQLARTTSPAKVAPRPGHIYVLRVIGSGGAVRAQFKLFVVDVAPGNASVTLRVGVMDFRQTGPVSCCDGASTRPSCAAAPRNLAVEQGPAGPRGQPLPAPSTGPSPGPAGATAASPGAVVGASVASAVVSVGASLALVFFCRRRDTPDESKSFLPPA